MKLTKFKKYIPVFILGIMLAIPVVSNAATKSVSLTTRQRSNSVTAKGCAYATVKGGAMIGGKGINYSIQEKNPSMKNYDEIAKGSCAPSTSFKTYKFQARSGYATGTNLKLVLSQHDTKKKNRGIGWGRIDY